MIARTLKAQAAGARSMAWNELSGPTARRKPKPLPLLDAVPEPIERPAITRTRRTIEKRLTAYEKAFAKARRFKPHDGSAAASVAKHDVQVAMTKLLMAEMRHEKARGE